ncbi:MAG: MoxR family ATPase [Opitutaceae bacterium]|jgi:MoxR-like ATPase|nr:MoxR family ATPase [Opitutaceae bacterium]
MSGQANVESGEVIVERIRSARKQIFSELHKIIIGQDKVLEQMVIGLLSGGHCLLTGVPGLGKTLLVRSIAETFSLAFKRIQFTPDLMPADIIGSEIVDEDPATGKRTFRFVEGPIFANIVLADEINRTPPKTQAALLEAMEERQLTAAGETHSLLPPFFVLATQNPIELEGTYPLPEAQLDRFLLNVYMDYLPKEDEASMVVTTTSLKNERPQAVFSGEEIIELQKLTRQVPVAMEVVRYAVNLVSATRPTLADASPLAKEKIKWGAGSRASQALVLAAKARALLEGRYTVAIEDIQALALPVLRHRIIPSFNAVAEGVTSKEIIEELLELVKV